MARRGRRRGRRGDGTITARDGKFTARYSRTEGGVRKRESKTFHLRIDAEWWLSQAKRHQQAPEDVRVAEYMERWLAGKRGIAESTKVLYRNHVRVHIVPVLGRYRLVELQRRHVDGFVENRVAYVSPTSKRPLSPKTIGAILVTLRSALAEAVPRTIPDNPAAKVEAPKPERRPVRAMTPDDARAIREAVRGSWMEHPVRVLLGSGMRVGELVALDQVDVHDGWVSLRKSKSPLRRVDLTADANAAIHEAVRKAPRVGKGEPVFFGERGDRLLPSSLYHAMKRATGTHPHALRHGFATMLVGQNVHMRIVAEVLGHADPALTARTYSHIAPASVRDALAVLDEVN